MTLAALFPSLELSAATWPELVAAPSGVYSPPPIVLQLSFQCTAVPDSRCSSPSINHVCYGAAAADRGRRVGESLKTAAVGPDSHRSGVAVTLGAILLRGLYRYRFLCDTPSVSDLDAPCRTTDSCFFLHSAHRFF